MLRICTLASGSSGNCTFISDGCTHLIIDAGISARGITNGLRGLGVQADELSAILITHEHWDHIRGLEVLLKKRSIPVYAAREGTAAALAELHPQLGICEFSTGCEFKIGGISITPIATSHDTSHSVGFRITSDGSCAVCATDLGYVSDDIKAAVCGAELVIIEANYDEEWLARGPYPPMLKRRIAGNNGHLSNSDCADWAVYAAENGVKHVVLGHLSRENNSPKLAYDTVCRRLMDAGFIPGVDVMLQVAPRSEPGAVYELKGELSECAK